MLTLKELHLRAALFHFLRDFFSTFEFLEVDTPIRLENILPELHIRPVESGSHFLQTSPELCMKRLLASGCTKIYQVCKCFRKEELGKKHLEEFTMLEWYRLHGDYYDLMDDCEKLLKYLADKLELKDRLPDLFNRLQLPWQKMTVEQAFLRWSPIPLAQALDEGSFDEILVTHIEPHLGGDEPLFLHEYPASMASLARLKESDPGVAERFELYIDGIELANGFSELTDPLEQKRRFTEEIMEIQCEWGREMTMPNRFLQDLEKIDRAAGIALGVDRLFMLFLGKRDIHASVTFAPADMNECG